MLPPLLPAADAAADTAADAAADALLFASLLRPRRLETSDAPEAEEGCWAQEPKQSCVDVERSFAWCPSLPACRRASGPWIVVQSGTALEILPPSIAVFAALSAEETATSHQIGAFLVWLRLQSCVRWRRFVSPLPAWLLCAAIVGLPVR